MADPITEINTATNIHFMPVVTNQLFQESPILHRIFRIAKEGDFGMALPSFDGRSLAEPLEIGEVGQEAATHTTGNVNVTQNSATVTEGSSAAAFTAAMANRGSLVTADAKAYAIKTVDSATQITLESVYEGGTLANQAYTITYYKDTTDAQGAYDKTDTWGAGTGDVLGSAEFTWKMYHNTIKIHNLDAAVNAGRSRIFDIVALKMRNATRRLRKDLITAFFSAQYDGGKGMVGLRAICGQTGLVGNIEKRKHAWWKGVVKATAGDLTWALLNDMWYKTKKFGNEDQVTLFVTTDGALQKYEDNLSKVVVTGAAGDRVGPNIYLGQNLTDQRKTIDGGFRAFEFKGIPIVTDPNVPTGHLFAINENYIHWRVLKSFTSTGWQQLRHHGSDWAQMTIFGYGALTTSCCSKFGMMTGVNEA